MSDSESYKSDSASSDDEQNYIIDAQMKKFEKKSGVEDEFSDESVVNEDSEELSDDDSEDNDEFGFMENGETAQPAKTARKKKTQVEESENNYIEYEDNGDMADDEDDEDEDADGAEYMRKFDENTRKNVISEYHPELFQHNTDEIEALCAVVRDSNGIVIDPLHRTIPFLTKYERARILGERAKQLNAGATPMVPISDDVIDGYLIALKELEQKAIPFIIKRPLLNGGCEYWKLKDLELL
jgi:DNA-directed RNA polymerase I, II, and III subunit RPABC2